MSQFSNKISDAKKTQQRFIFKSVLAVVFLFLISLIGFFFLYAKKIITKPNVNNYYLEFLNGKGLVLFKRILFFSEKITIKVFSEGYEAFENSYIKDESNEILISLIEKDINLKFTTDSEIGQNNWFLNNKLISSQNVLNLTVKPGSYKLRLENKFYKTKSFNFNFANKTDKKN